MRTKSSAYYRFYNSFTAQLNSESEAAVVLRCMDRCIPSGHPVGWDFAEVDDDFVVMSNANLMRFRATLRGWGDANDEDEVEGDSEEGLEENIEVFRRVLTYEEKFVAVREYLLRVGKIAEVVL